MNQDQREALFGPESPYSDHKTGETIRFMDGSEEKTGRILHVIPPGQAYEGGTHGGILYAVETRSKGFPSIVSPSDIIV
jgi:hypothetical protein